MDKHVIDGDKVISINTEGEDRVEAYNLNQHEIYAVDIIVTGGEEARAKVSE